MFESQLYAQTVNAYRFSEARLAQEMFRRRALQLNDEDRAARRRRSGASRVPRVRAMVGWLLAARRW